MKLPSESDSRSAVGVAVRRALLAAAVVTAAMQTPQLAAAEEELEEIVVTGSILRRQDTESVSPISILSAETLEERGINTVAEAMQRLPSNNAGTISAGWNTGFNFASGATAPALRGLTVQSTLSIADGMRLAPYPLADDGQRNFVDLNTIPSAVIERIEVLRDGASSTYGADAIAGVVNVITKKEIQGVQIGASYGISQEGDGSEMRVDATFGMGDLQEDGYNFYISAEFQKQDQLWARDRGYPFNTMDLQQICGPTGSCMPNLNWNSVTAEDGATHIGLVTIPGVSLVRPITSATGNNGTGQYSYLNPAAGCRDWPSHNLGTTVNPIAPATLCEVNFQGAYIMLQPDVERTGLTGRLTKNFGENTQAYAMVNWYQTENTAEFTPLGFNGLPTPPRASTVLSYNVNLPVYVCPTGVGTFNSVGTGCTAANGTLNPQNPYAAAGQRAHVILRSIHGRSDNTTSEALRGALGVSGIFGDDWRWAADFTASQVELNREQLNYFVPARIMDAAARGTFNFVDPYANTQEQWDFIAPPSSVDSKSELWQIQATLAKDLMDLKGGPLQAAVGVAYRDESIDAPSGNPANDAQPYERYYSINSVSAAGSRDVTSGFFEVNAPVLEQLELTASGRFDDYSTGQSNFSPKLGFKWSPVEWAALRGTWSEGFRIPSFNESFGLPTTGYVTRQVSCTTNAAWCASHGNNAYATAPYSLGLTQSGNTELDPEESTSYSVGLIIEPTSNLSFTIDFWRIEVDNLIVGVTDTSAAEAQYYANNGVVDIPGTIAVPGVPDAQFPNALPVLGFIQTSYTNQDSQLVSGIDFNTTLLVPFGNGLQWRSILDVSYLMDYELQLDAGGDPLVYVDTLSPCNVTSCSGAPQWRASWQNTLEFGKATVSLTAYYTSGYDTASIDFGGVKGDCQGNADIASSTSAYVDGSPVACRSEDVWNVDLTARYELSDSVTIYGDILNVFDIEAPFDHAAAYGLFNFNPAWAGPNMMGRFFRVGAKFNF